MKRNVLTSALHASKYQAIISSLKKQVNELKEELNNQDGSSNISKAPKKDQDTKNFDQLKAEMEGNYQKEIENRKSYIDNERVAIESSIKLFQYKTEFERNNKEFGKTNVKTKQAEDNMKTEQKIIEKCNENRKKIDDTWDNLK